MIKQRCARRLGRARRPLGQKRNIEIRRAGDAKLRQCCRRQSDGDARASSIRTTCACVEVVKTWMPATSAGMTGERQCVSTSGMTGEGQRANSAPHPFERHARGMTMETQYVSSSWPDIKPFVMAGLVPAIHVLLQGCKTWMPGTRPGMTGERQCVSIRHGRTCSGHPRLWACKAAKTWMPGIKPGMTAERQRANSASHPFELDVRDGAGVTWKCSPLRCLICHGRAWPGHPRLCCSKAARRGCPA